MIDFTQYGIRKDIGFHEIQCPECKEWVAKEKWGEAEAYCDICGTHDAIACPECYEVFDYVWHPEFKAR